MREMMPSLLVVIAIAIFRRYIMQRPTILVELPASFVKDEIEKMLRREEELVAARAFKLHLVILGMVLMFMPPSDVCRIARQHDEKNNWLRGGLAWIFRWLARRRVEALRLIQAGAEIAIESGLDPAMMTIDEGAIERLRARGGHDAAGG